MPAYLKRLLIKPIIYLVLSLIVLSAVVFQLQVIADEVKQGFITEERQVDAMYGELQQMTDDLALVQKYQTAYTQLKQLGLIGGKQRADWIDKFMEVVASFQAKDVSFELEARKQLNQLDQLNLDGRFVSYELVNFKGSFQHESDALSFLSRVKEKVEPLLMIDRCEFSLVAHDEMRQYRFQYQPIRGNIVLECQLYWLELQVPPEMKSEDSTT